MTPNPTPDPLDPIRKEIDEADRQLIQILARRFDAVKRVGNVKREEDAPLLDTERERRSRPAGSRTPRPWACRRPSPGGCSRRS